MWFSTEKGQFLNTPIQPNNKCLRIHIEEEYLWERFSIAFNGNYVNDLDFIVHGDFAESIESNVIRRKIISF